jgi:hypothetical protein
MIRPNKGSGAMKLTINHNGFHGRNHATVHVTDQDYRDRDDIAGYEITRRQAVRANRRVCGGGDCRCGEHIATYIGGHADTWIIEADRITQPEGRAVTSATIEMRGNYPQSH